MQVLFPSAHGLQAGFKRSLSALQLAGKLEQPHWRCVAVSSNLLLSIHHQEA